MLTFLKNLFKKKSPTVAQKQFDLMDVPARDRASVGTIAMMAHDCDYIVIDFQRDNKMISFAKTVDKNERINVYYTTMTVGTCIDHPTKGRTQLFRRDVTYKELVAIFRNPRAHTNKGYYER